MSFKLVSVNIEGHRHLEQRVLPFLQQEKPDVICLQECFERDVKRLASELAMQPFYTPMSNVTTENPHVEKLGYWGLLVLVRKECEILEQKAEYYVGKREEIPIFFENENPNSINRAILWTRFRLPGEEQERVVATTHFTWSPQGKTTDEQRQNFAGMKKILQTLPLHVLCGDFNAPRGREIFTQLSEMYKDNIPSEILTTLDENLHKAGRIEYVVDGMFSSPGIEVQNVRVVPGVSDHQAIVATIL